MNNYPDNNLKLSDGRLLIELNGTICDSAVHQFNLLVPPLTPQVELDYYVSCILMNP